MSGGFRLLVSMILMGALVGGCGPERSSDEERKDKINDQVQDDEQFSKAKKEELERKAAFRRPQIEAMLGQFKGSYRLNGRMVQLSLELQYTEISTPVPSSSEVVFFPAVTGLLKSGSEISVLNRFTYGSDDASRVLLESSTGHVTLDISLDDNGNLYGYLTGRGISATIYFQKER